MRTLKRWAALLLEAVWPRRVICLCCGRPSRGAYLCPDCQKKLDALRIPAERAGAHAVWVYRDESRALVHALKYHAVADAAQVLAEGIADVARTLSLPPETVITWPTMPATRAAVRGIDHGRLLAEAVGSRLSLPVRRLLTRSNRQAMRTQAGLGREERLSRLEGVFSCEEPLSGPVLLIDDVLTTSATTTTCARCLMEAGASAVTVITATKTLRKPQRNDREE